MAIKVVICCWSYLFGEGLRRLLEDDKNIDIIGIFYEGIDLKDIVKLSPDVILADFNNINPHLFSHCPESKIVLIDTGVKQGNIIAALVSHNISGVISPRTDIHLLKKALKVISNGEVWIDNPTLKELLLQAEVMSKNGGISGITGREREIIAHICQGYSNKEIASRLLMSEQTVKSHLNRIFRKFNVFSRSQLITVAFKNQIYQS